MPRRLGWRPPARRRTDGIGFVKEASGLLSKKGCKYTVRACVYVLHMYMYTQANIYIFIHRYTCTLATVCIYVYIYIYTYILLSQSMCLFTDIYTCVLYIKKERETCIRAVHITWYQQASGSEWLSRFGVVVKGCGAVLLFWEAPAYHGFPNNSPLSRFPLNDVYLGLIKGDLRGSWGTNEQGIAAYLLAKDSGPWQEEQSTGAPGSGDGPLTRQPSSIWAPL